MSHLPLAWPWCGTGDMCVFSWLPRHTHVSSDLCATHFGAGLGAARPPQGVSRVSSHICTICTVSGSGSQFPIQLSQAGGGVARTSAPAR